MKLIFFFFFFVSLLQAKIIECRRIEDLLSHVDSAAWLLIDLDDTLIEGVNQLGRAKWYDHETQKLMKKGMSRYEAQMKFYPQWILAQTICPSRSVESNSAQILARAQDLSQHAIALTARHPAIASLTVEQLQKLSIDFSRSSLEFPRQFKLPQTLYRNGIWFLTDFVSKGTSFVRLLDVYSHLPQRIVMIDDSRHHLEDMERALSSHPIEFIGLHYIKAHERHFDAQVADLQYQALPEILSDADAKKILDSPRRERVS